MFANLNPKIPTNALPVCCIILDNADAVFEAFTKSLGLKVFLTSLTKLSINLNYGFSIMRNIIELFN